MQRMDDRALLELAARLAAEAAIAIEAVRHAGFEVERKSDRTPVTAADRIAEVLIVDGLRAATPDIPVIAEEEVAGGLVTATAERFWLVDPLDGTREFAAGNPNYAVCIGLVVDDAPLLGALALPATGERYGGLVGVGAWKEDADGRRPIGVRPHPADGARVLIGRHRGDDPRIPPFLATRQVAEVVSFGSAEKFCRVAEGSADLYARFGRTFEWDTAAGQALVEAAGGRVATMDGARLRYGKPGFENPDFLVEGG